jgi:hypothetical protein
MDHLSPRFVLSIIENMNAEFSPPPGWQHVRKSDRRRVYLCAGGLRKGAFLRKQIAQSIDTKLTVSLSFMPSVAVGRGRSYTLRRTR